MYHLYVKTHNVTGYKYLGQTIKDPYTYKGSGILWTRHIKKYGNDVSTDVLSICKNHKELEVCGLFFSKLFDVVNSEEWANLVVEQGKGSSGFKLSEYQLSILRQPKSEEWKAKRRGKGKPLTEEHKEKLRKPKLSTINMCGSHGGKHKNPRLKLTEQHKLNLRKPKSEEHKKKLSQKLKGRIPWNKGLKTNVNNQIEFIIMESS